MDVTCEILLRNTNTIYKVGYSVEGVVKYIIDKPTEFTSVIISFKAKELSFEEIITSNTEDVETEDYIDQHMDLLHAKENKTAVITTGTYDKQFCFVLPEEIPSSYKDFTFYLQLKFMEANSVRSPKKFYINIQVQSGVRIIEYVRKVNKVFTLSKKIVTLTPLIKKSVFIEGEDVTVNWEITNYEAVPILASKFEFIEFHNGRYVKRKSMILKGIETKYFGLNRLKSKHSYVGRMFIPITTKKEYGVKITLLFPFLHKELCLNFPVFTKEKIDNFEEEEEIVAQEPCWQAMYSK